MKKTFNRGAVATAIALAISGQAFAADGDNIERKQTESSISTNKAEEKLKKQGRNKTKSGRGFIYR